MRIFSFDNGVYTTAGHNVDCSLELTKELNRRNIENETFVWRHAPEDIIERLGATPLFQENLYAGDGLSDDHFEIFNNKYYEDLKTLGPDFFNGDDVIIIYTNSHFMLGGLGKWLSEILPEKRPFIVLYMSFAYYSIPDVGDTFRRLYTQAFACFPDDAKEKQIFLAHSETNKENYEEMSNREVIIAPFIVPFSGLSSRKSYTKGEKLKISFLGHSRLEKGFEMLSSLARNLKDRKDIQFFVQYTESLFKDVSHGHPVKRTVRTLQRFDEDYVKVHVGEFSREDYDKHLTESDIILVPYMPLTYTESTSGVFMEALTAGIPVIATDGTWMARQIEHYGTGGASFSPAMSGRACSDAIIEVIENYQHHHEKALEASKKAREWFSIEHFVDFVLEIVNSASKG